MELFKKDFLVGNNLLMTCFIVVGMVDNEEQFLVRAVDIATFLGYKLPRKAIYDHVPKESKLTWGELTVTSSEYEANWPPHTIFLTESGLHSLIDKSRSINAVNAVPFQKWLYYDILPSICSTGKYDKIVKHIFYFNILSSSFKISFNQ